MCRLLIVAGLLCAGALIADEGGWPYYGNDAGGSRYSPLTQIDATNLDRLEIAWQFRTGELGQNARQGHRLTFQATPVLWGGKLYLSTAFGEAIAVDATTGEEIWRFNSEVPRDMGFGEVASRGVTIWEDGLADPTSDCAARVFMGNILGRLYALDARTGRRCEDFGEQGMVDMRQGARSRNEGNYTITSPPALAGDRLIVGSAIGDNSAVDLARGIVRALDVRSGDLHWTWDPIPTDPDDPAYSTWETGVEETGGANAWPPLSVDVGNGLVFVPTGSPSPDFYGGERLGDGVYANSIVALHIESGEVAWYRQLVHHDVWDYDLPAQPLLIDLRRGGQTIPVVVQTTKMGMVFVFNRVNGEPVYPIEERAVPQGGVEGEHLSPTQPFSSLPPLVSHDPIGDDDAWGMLFFDKRACAKKLSQYRSDGIFTPPSLQGTMMNPGYAGGSNWGGLAWDPSNQIIVATVMELPLWVRLTPRQEAIRLQELGQLDREGLSSMSGTPYVMNRGLVESPLGIPCTKPPWGNLVAMDLAKGAIAWKKPLGTIEDLAPAIVPNLELGTPVIGGAIVTASGLVFVGAASDDYLRAIDLKTGEELWKGRLPAGGQATPMSYQISGRQYVVIAAGGHGSAGTTRGDYLVAFSLDPD
ncbi:MAG: pyrroloquinoline quinone-dependent dehydrogenase [Gammaproteobacteria bacterium]|nr:pyrroloquinoline quinone-dependent dehydrogenase [Gammaproteobacteria bacterium]